MILLEAVTSMNIWKIPCGLVLSLLGEIALHVGKFHSFSKKVVNTSLNLGILNGLYLISFQLSGVYLWKESLLNIGSLVEATIIYRTHNGDHTYWGHDLA